MQYPLEELDRNETYEGVKELAAAAERYLRSVGSPQTKEKQKTRVTEFPNERTVRHYIAEGLITSANKEGGVLIFGYKHLLALLTIKKLLLERLPISVIRSLLEGKTETELEKLLNEEVRVFTHRRDLDEYRRSIGHTDDSEVIEVPLSKPEKIPAAEKNAAKEYLESLLLDRPRERPESSVPAAAASRAGSYEPGPEADSWKRYKIVPGVEVHVERSYRAPSDRSERRKIIEVIERILHLGRTR